MPIRAKSQFQRNRGRGAVTSVYGIITVLTHLKWKISRTSTTSIWVSECVCVYAFGAIAVAVATFSTLHFNYKIVLFMIISVCWNYISGTSKSIRICVFMFCVCCCCSCFILFRFDASQWILPTCCCCFFLSMQQIASKPMKMYHVHVSIRFVWAANWFGV